MDVVALLAHPDDELMCAGTLHRYVEEGHNVKLVTVFLDEREPEWKACVDLIGCQAQGIPSFGEDGFVWSRRTVQHLEPIVGWPDLLITHRVEDDNTSHGHLGRVGRTIARKNRTSLWELDQTIPGGLTTHPQPNHFVAINGAVKMDAVCCYRSQLERYPDLEMALFHRDRLYGWQIGVGYAEGFTIHRSVLL